MPVLRHPLFWRSVCPSSARGVALSSALVFAALSAGCASSPGSTGAGQNRSQPATAAATPDAPAPSRDVTHFYAGTITVRSPDGSQVYGAPEASVAKRKIQAQRSRITEEVFDDGKMRGVEILRREGTTVFDATDHDRTFHGQMTFHGEPGAWTGWTYAITMQDGARIEGDATVTPQGFVAEKRFIDPSGTPRVRIDEQWREVDRAEYERVLGELTAKAKAKAGAKAEAAAPVPPG